MRRYGALLVSVCLGAILGACASSGGPPAPRYYSLSEHTSGDAGSRAMPRARLQVTRVEANGFLGQTGIVSIDAGGTLHRANYHHWSDVPAKLLGQTLNRCLAVTPNRLGAAREITLELHAFQGTGDGRGVISGVWRSHKPGQRTPRGEFLFEFGTPLASDGFGPLVEALSASAEALCADIAARAR